MRYHKNTCFLKKGKEKINAISQSYHAHSKEMVTLLSNFVVHCVQCFSVLLLKYFPVMLTMGLSIINCFIHVVGRLVIQFLSTVVIAQNCIF